MYRYLWWGDADAPVAGRATRARVDTRFTEARRRHARHVGEFCEIAVGPLCAVVGTLARLAGLRFGAARLQPGRVETNVVRTALVRLATFAQGEGGVTLGGDATEAVGALCCFVATGGFRFRRDAGVGLEGAHLACAFPR